MEDFHRLLQVSSASSASGGDENGSVADSALDGYSDESKGDTAMDDRSIGETTAALLRTRMTSRSGATPTLPFRKSQSVGGAKSLDEVEHQSVQPLFDPDKKDVTPSVVVTDALFMSNMSTTMPKATLPKYDGKSFVMWLQRICLALIGIVGVEEIIQAVCRGDPTGAEPILSPTHLSECTSTLTSVDRNGHKTQFVEVNYVKAVELTMAVRQLEPSSLRKWIDQHVVGKTLPHRNWSVCNRQLFQLVWKALDQDTRERVMVDAPRSVLGNAVWLLARLKKIIDPSTEVSVVKALFALMALSMVVTQSFTDFYVEWRNALRKFAAAKSAS